MPVRPLPPNANLDHLKHQAKDLLRLHEERRPDVAQRIREFHPRFKNASDAQIFGADLKLSDAQLTIARESGFASWPRLKKHIERPTLADKLTLPHHERIEDAAFRQAVDLLDAGDAAGLREHLRQHHGLARQQVVLEGGNYLRNPTLLEFIAENPTRRGRLPQNVVEIARVILEAGTTQSAMDESLALVASSNVAHQSGEQISLINVLCDYGADPNVALRTALMYGEFDAANALLRRGARIELPVAAALGRTEEARRLLPAASAEDRHWALALASQFNHLEVVRLLLDAGEDPNRYNPVGGHSHSTPLHQAAAGGYLELAQLLVARGASLGLRDTMWNATPAEWAKHEGKAELEAYLLGPEARGETR
jgi:Ankyrin repeats (many copies)